MSSQTLKRVTASQPAVIMATALAAISLHRWPAVAAVFVLLQIGIVLAIRRPRAQRVRTMRFLARANAVPQPAADEAQPLPRRPHLHLVP